MIFYFTGTGNSLYVAKQLDTELYSIPQVIKEGQQTFKADKIGIVCPVYGHGVPYMVRDFLKKAVFETDYFYMVLTYGNIHGGAAELADTMLQEFGRQADYINTILMVDNFLPAFDMAEQMSGAPEKKIEEYIGEIRADIDAGKHWIQPVTQKDRDWHQAGESESSPYDGELSGVYGMYPSLPGNGGPAQYA